MLLYPRELSPKMSGGPSSPAEASREDNESRSGWRKVFDIFDTPFWDPKTQSVDDPILEEAVVSTHQDLDLGDNGKPYGFTLHPLSEPVQQGDVPNFSRPFTSHSPSMRPETREKSQSQSICYTFYGEFNTTNTLRDRETQTSMSDLTVLQDIPTPQQPSPGDGGVGAPHTAIRSSDLVDDSHEDPMIQIEPPKISLSFQGQHQRRESSLSRRGDRESLRQRALVDDLQEDLIIQTEPPEISPQYQGQHHHHRETSLSSRGNRESLRQHALVDDSQEDLIVQTELSEFSLRHQGQHHDREASLSRRGDRESLRQHALVDDSHKDLIVQTELSEFSLRHRGQNHDREASLSRRGNQESLRHHALVDDSQKDLIILTKPPKISPRYQGQHHSRETSLSSRGNRGSIRQHTLVDDSQQDSIFQRESPKISLQYQGQYHNRETPLSSRGNRGSIRQRALVGDSHEDPITQTESSEFSLRHQGQHHDRETSLSRRGNRGSTRQRALVDDSHEDPVIQTEPSNFSLFPRSQYHNRGSSLSSSGNRESTTQCASTPPSSPGVATQFNCTFCLRPYRSQQAWQDHETAEHLEKCLESPSNERGRKETRSSKKPTRARSIRAFISRIKTPRMGTSTHQEPSLSIDPTLLWSCGICDQILNTWDDRESHLAEHFSQGETMAHWDCLVSPYPWKKHTIPSIDAPDWDLDFLFALHSTIAALPGESPSHLSQAEQHRFSCETCHLAFYDGNTCIRHIELWHIPRDTWICPTVGESSELDDFYDEVTGHDGIPVDYCSACDELLPPDDTAARIQHMQDVHNFCSRPCADATADRQRFYLHLATVHNFTQDRIGDFMNRHSIKKQPPFANLRRGIRGGSDSLL
ncbi:hypothetical protein BJX63DRAFT_275932 [Aspergillus granulosus]|uniref:C2H2-type domain-containing protein n=1 Tax=Aspergillus granulosus TaxID=176169 RepID=A0ABR4H7V7_9EURO